MHVSYRNLEVNGYIKWNLIIIKSCKCDGYGFEHHTADEWHYITGILITLYLKIVFTPFNYKVLEPTLYYLTYDLLFYNTHVQSYLLKKFVNLVPLGWFDNASAIQIITYMGIFIIPPHWYITSCVYTVFFIWCVSRVIFI